MYIPSSTYRIQLNSSFRFSELVKLIDYLDKMGIDTIYAAPFLQATKGSTHGYDVTNPEIINPELGTMEEFETLISLLKKKNIGWLQDIVPNHMGYNAENTWLMDIFEKGMHSEYVSFFDINWNDPEMKDKVLFPFLKNSKTEWIKDNEIKLEYHQNGFFININSNPYPASWKSYYTILSYISLTQQNENWLTSFLDIKEAFKEVENNFEDSLKAFNSIHYKEQLFELYTSDLDFKKIFTEGIIAINLNEEKLKDILHPQFFEPAPFTITDSKINYRRFFTVNDLICLKIEKQEVFDRYHSLLKELLEEGMLQGLRVDHIDGLYNPAQYLERLRKMAGKDTYLIVEKILDAEEDMPAGWPIQGTSGYEFLSVVNRLFVKEENKDIFSSIYKNFTGNIQEYDEIVFEKKTMMISEKMQGEINNLITLLEQNNFIANQDKRKLKEALIILMASFSVYRTYISESLFSETDKKNLSIAFENAMKRKPDLKNEIIHLQNILIPAVNDTPEQKENKIKFILRFQQFTGPIAAKGVEDTSFYIFNRLISHNEVGDTPRLFGASVDSFHHFMIKRQKEIPFSLNATSTHDTKRGEDARIRINLLTSIPEEWELAVESWANNNKKYKKQDANKNEIPSRNDEYFIYQSLIGGFSEEEKKEIFLKRFKDFITKAIREAKVNTHSENPAVEYENGTLDFIEAILQDVAFMNMFIPFLTKVIHYSIPHSLSQTLIKITAPGIPDTYQGTELWELSFVDPDNRRTIDFEKRKKYLDEILKLKEAGRANYLEEIKRTKTDARIKFFTTWASLNERRKSPLLFNNGDYIPLSFSGNAQHALIGYARNYQKEWCLVIILRDACSINYKNLISSKEEDLWGNCIVKLPENAPEHWRNVFTNQSYNSHSPIGKALFINDLLGDFPVAFLKNSDLIV